MSNKYQTLFPPLAMAINSNPDIVTEQAMKVVMDLPRKKNVANQLSLDEYVLDTVPELSEWNKWIHQCLDDYYRYVLGIPHHVNCKITQSWFTYTTINEHMHQHKHPNSMVSGVFYPKANPEEDHLKFERTDEHKLMAWNVPEESINEYNATTYTQYVGTGDLILFNSSIEHWFETVQRPNDTRVSLAFNSYPVGDFYAGVETLQHLNIDVKKINKFTN